MKCMQDTGWARLMRSYSSAGFCFESELTVYFEYEIIEFWQRRLLKNLN